MGTDVVSVPFVWASVFKFSHDYKRKKVPSLCRFIMLSLCAQVFTFTWREDIRPGDPQHTKKFCFDAVSHTSPVTLYDCHSMKGNQLWKYRKVRQPVGGPGDLLALKSKKESDVTPLSSQHNPLTHA